MIWWQVAAQHDIVEKVDLPVRSTALRSWIVWQPDSSRSLCVSVGGEESVRKFISQPDRFCCSPLKDQINFAQNAERRATRASHQCQNSHPSHFPQADQTRTCCLKRALRQKQEYIFLPGAADWIDESATGPECSLSRRRCSPLNIAVVCVHFLIRFVGLSKDVSGEILFHVFTWLKSCAKSCWWVRCRHRYFCLGAWQDRSLSDNPRFAQLPFPAPGWRKSPCFW